MSDTITDQAAKATKAPEQTRSVEVINERPTVDLKQERENAIKSERARIDSINGIAEAAKTRGLVLDANKAIRDGLSAQDFQNDAFQRLTDKHTDYTPASNLSRGEQRDLVRGAQ